MLIAVSSFGESLRRVLLTAPAEAVFNKDLAFIRNGRLTLCERKNDPTLSKLEIYKYH
jgi:hypothetical protein